MGHLILLGSAQLTANVPPESRPHRMGFHTPGRRWLRSPHNPRKPAIPFHRGAADAKEVQ